ncbi:MAG: 6-phosphogluconolactonase [Verrucomicrobiota bacterium]|jgi:6-phosphogluconolactonase|nr:6-phosphogluconolactonase [Verrucomicrobiota bacterium]MDK2964078.1 6-phosphogluconolactonase [Verrucomicrobiota bacterium]
MKLQTFQTTEKLIFNGLETLQGIFPTLGKNDGVMLAGGRTPLDIYRRAAAEKLCTDGILFLSDERYVPADDPQSNYGTISPFFPTLLKIRTERPIEEAAAAFHRDLSRIESVPLGLLGLGADGHTASLFNLQDAGLRDERLAVPVVKTEKPDRISVTPTFLRKIDKIIILATGAEKKKRIQTLLAKPGTIPAGVALADHPDVEIWTDQQL